MFKSMNTRMDRNRLTMSVESNKNMLNKKNGSIYFVYKTSTDRNSSELLLF